MEANYFTKWFFHTLTWVSHGCTCVPHPEPPSYLPPHPIPQGHPSAPALSTVSHAWSLDWQSISYTIIYIFQCYSLKSSHPRLLPWEGLFTRTGGQCSAGESKRDWEWHSGVWEAIWKIMPVTEMWKAEEEASSRAHIWKGLVMSTWKIFQLICLLGSLFTFLCLSWYTQQGQSHSVSNHRNFHFLIQKMCSWYHFYS